MLRNKTAAKRQRERESANSFAYIKKSFSLYSSVMTPTRILKLRIFL